MAAESVEGRGPTEGNASQQATDRTQSRKPVSLGLCGVRLAARRDKRMRFTALLHHITPELLKACFLDLKRQATPGIDGVTWQDYAKDLETRIADLHNRIHRGSYRAQPSKRTWIPKADGRQRPLGLAAVEDKIVQQAVKEVLECIYEADFLGFSYGFRPARGCHDALDALWVGLTRKKVNWLLDADIQGFFDRDRPGMAAQVRPTPDCRSPHAPPDPEMVAGGHDGRRPVVGHGSGHPARGGDFAALANIVLHHVLDLWIVEWRKRHATGDIIVVRYADDFVIGFQHQSEAKRCLDELRKRFREFGLELHPEKTRLIEFGRFAASQPVQAGSGQT